jgi:Cu(I)/Ag(I) efflux system membrane protein CusA/SilA
VPLPPGYYVEWSGRWQNQEHARRQLQVVLPVVLLVIFVLLYFTYHSAIEAAHVLLAVPFALTGGVYLLWALGYNFSVAVWVGFIALFGTAVQTGVVMVIYLEDAVRRKREQVSGRMTHLDLRDAIVEGALLRLRPKVMTVSTVVAGLLPIMWSTRVGAEVIRPLATPVLGGMVSSLLHVLIVTPVIFFWIEERRLGLRGEAGLHPPCRRRPSGRRAREAFTSRPVVLVAGIIALAAVAIATWNAYRTSSTAPVSEDRVVQRVQAGDTQLVLASPTGVLRQGRNTFVLEFRSPDGNLVDVGTVRASATMPMPGMVMSGGLETTPTAVPGRYEMAAEFGMAGTWQMTVEWDGPAGRGSVDFEGTVQ